MKLIKVLNSSCKLMLYIHLHYARSLIHTCIFKSQYIATWYDFCTLSCVCMELLYTSLWGGLGVFILAYWRLPPAPSAAPSTRPHGTPHHHAQHPLRGSQRPPPTAPPPPRPVPPPRLPAPAPTAPHTTPPSTPATAPSTHPHGASHHTLHRAQHSPQHPPPRHPTPPRPAPPPRLPAPAPTAPHTTPAQHPLRGPQHPPPRHPTPPRPAPPPRPPAPAPPPYDTPHPPPRPAYPPGVVAIFPHRKNSGGRWKNGTRPLCQPGLRLSACQWCNTLTRKSRQAPRPMISMYIPNEESTKSVHTVSKQQEPHEDGSPLAGLGAHISENPHSQLV